MRIIKRLITDMAGNIDEARDKIRTAYELKAEYPKAAEWYRSMAAAHLGFNDAGHKTVSEIVEVYKASDEYKRRPEYADGMLAAWEAVHSDLTAKCAEVKAMIDGYK